MEQEYKELVNQYGKTNVLLVVGNLKAYKRLRKKHFLKEIEEGIEEIIKH